MMPAESVIDATLCARCGGRCCHETPGVWVDPQRFHQIFSLPQRPRPDDYVDDFTRLGLEWRDLGSIFVPLPQSGDSGCDACAADGCRYTPDQRPCQCLALIPNGETLRQDELLCELPDDFRLIQARRNWTLFWEQRQNSGEG